MSDLRQDDLEGICTALDVEDEGVFVGVMLDDVIIHVHQDTVAKLKHWINQLLGIKVMELFFFLSASTLTLFYFSCILWRSSL